MLAGTCLRPSQSVWTGGTDGQAAGSIPGRRRDSMGRTGRESAPSTEEVASVLPLASDAKTTSDIISSLDQADVRRGPRVEVSAEQLLSPVTTDAQIFAQGLNYVAHASEAQHANRKSNLIFTKASSALTGPYGDVVRPSEVQLLDYEVEFGLVLRKDLAEGQEVTDKTIGDAVAGVVLCNDVSARDTMFGATFMQWYRGKSYRTFCPTGPALWLLEPGEVRDTLQNLEIKLWVNGELRQSANSQQLIWKPAEFSFVYRLIHRHALW